MFDAQEKYQEQFFKEAWNSASTGVDINGDCVLDEWNWLLAWLVVACENAVHSVASMQLDDNEDDEMVYVTDIADFNKLYYLVGVVWSSVIKHFASNSRISDAIKTMFLEKSDAIAAGLPTREVNAK